MSNSQAIIRPIVALLIAWILCASVLFCIMRNPHTKLQYTNMTVTIEDMGTQRVPFGFLQGYRDTQYLVYFTTNYGKQSLRVSADAYELLRIGDTIQIKVAKDTIGYRIKLIGN